MYNNHLIKSYDLKNRINKHPYDTTLSLDEFKQISERMFLQSAICNVAPNDANFIKANNFYMGTLTNVDEINKTIESYNNDSLITYKFYYCYFWVNPFESTEQKQNYIKAMNNKQLPQIYIYDYEQQKSTTIQMDDVHKMFNWVLELTPQQWFEKIKNDYLTKIYTNDVIEELQTMFLNMPCDVLQVEQPTLFDDYYKTPNAELIQSKEHLFFDNFITNLDIYTDNEKNIKSYYDFLNYKTNTTSKPIWQQHYDAISQKIKDYEQEHNPTPIDTHTIIEVQTTIADVEGWGNIYISDESTRQNLEQKNKYLDELKTSNEYLFNLALQRHIWQRLDDIQQRLDEEQKKMDNCNVNETNEHFINEQIKHYVGLMNQNPIVNMDVENATNKRIIEKYFLFDELARNWKNAFDIGAYANNNSVALNKKLYGVVGNINFGIESFENNKQFNNDYMALYGAIVSYWVVNGTKPFTTRQLYEIYTDNEKLSHPSDDLMQWINNAIFEMAKTWFSMSGATSVNAEYKKEGYFLPIEPINNEIKLNGFLFNDEYRKQNPYNMVWHLIKAPFLYDYSMANDRYILKLTNDKNYLIPSKNSNLPTPNSNSIVVNTIKYYLTMAINGIKTGYRMKHEFVLREFLNDTCKIDLSLKSKKQVDAMKNVIKQFLDIAKENNDIKSYEFKRSSKNKNLISFYIY